MITAVDTNVLLDILIPAAPHGDESEARLAAAIRAGTMVIAEAVYAELAAHFDGAAELDGFLDETGIRLEPSDSAALHLAGTAWRTYARQRTTSFACAQCGASQALHCEHCGAPLQARQHLVADFMIGAHAIVHADVLLTRDRGYYRRYFPELTLD